MRIGNLTVEYVSQPLGLDVARPRFSWHPGSEQTAYQIQVAGVWDSGKVASADSLLVPYDGPPLASRTRYHWSVRVWDGEDSASSEPSWWETGLLDQDDWAATWIAPPRSMTGLPSMENAWWIWSPEDEPVSHATSATRWFRTAVDVPPGVTRARLAMAAQDGFTAFIGGTQVAQAADWRRPVVVDVTDRLRDGANTIAVSATNATPEPAGLIGTVELTTPEGMTTIPTDQSWRYTDQEPAGDWQAPGYDDSSWPTVRATRSRGSAPPGHCPATQLRREFRLAGRPVARARLYITALGLYEAELNGKRVGTEHLAPGWTDYRTRVQYQTHDVTQLLREGDNALGVSLATGWYAGNLVWYGPHHYGDRPALLAQLEVAYEDGSTARFVTDDGWRVATGPITGADLLAGEDYDARLETPGWTLPGFDDTAWIPAVPVDGVTAEVVAQADRPVRVTQELTPQAVTEPEPGVHVVDLGQNMVGTVRLKVSGEPGTVVTLRHAEVLNPDGTIYTTNLRSVRATDTYTLKGGGEETFQPRFTFHGFRYVEVTGCPGPPSITGLVMHTAAPYTIEFDTDVPMLNQLHHNITWGLRGNFVSVPTDTPARDERLGWTGDINVFAPTAAYLMESARFLTKWLQDLRDAQLPSGAYTDVAPHVGPASKGAAAGWGDAGVTVPWALYQAYGDRRVLEQSWASMLKWLDHLERQSHGYLRPAEGYGDWLNIDDETPKDVIATAYFAHSADLVARIAVVLGEDPVPYEELFAKVRQAFRDAYVTESGRIEGDTQTAYVLALSMNLLDSREAAAAADRLVQLIEARDWHLSTGFLGTPRLLPVLTAAGRIDVAYRLLHQRTFPSWGYPIDRGATTMWERWDSIRPDGSFQDAEMNSFNHYAYGSVGEWMYATIAGIAPASPGYRKLIIRPRPGGQVNEAKARFQSPHGPVATHWTRRDDVFRLDVTLPPNTTAEIWIPARRAADVDHGGTEFLRMADGCAVFAAGSGTHHFREAVMQCPPVSC